MWSFNEIAAHLNLGKLFTTYDTKNSKVIFEQNYRKKPKFQ